MKRAEAILRKILFPGPLLSLLSVPLAAVLLCCAFFLFEEESPLTYHSKCGSRCIFRFASICYMPG